MIRQSVLAAAALLLVSATASSAEAPRPTGYLPSSVLDGKSILPPPPAADSPQGRADQAFYDDSRGLKDTPRWKLAQQDNDLWQGGALKRFSCVLGAEISQGETPTAWKLLHRVMLDVSAVGTPPKDHFARRRPALGNDQPICVPRETWLETNASYPSGHAMVAWTWALILTEAAPQKADAILRLGQEAGDSRAVCGVHYPTDVQAGRNLAAGMVARLHAEPAFMSDLAEAKREIAAARTPPTGCGA